MEATEQQNSDDGQDTFNSGSQNASTPSNGDFDGSNAGGDTTASTFSPDQMMQMMAQLMQQNNLLQQQLNARTTTAPTKFTLETEFFFFLFLLNSNARGGTIPTREVRAGRGREQGKFL